MLFASTVFAEGATGPATYARYLWQAFGSDEQLDFHMLVPKAAVSHKNIHQYGEPVRAPGHHRLISNALRKLAGGFDIVHSNNAHSIAGVRLDSMLICQVNDYEVADAYRNFPANVRRKGLWKACTLLWRYGKEKRGLQRADLALANSGYVREAIIREYGLDEKKCRTLYKAVDTGMFRKPREPEPDPWGDRGSQQRLLFVGSNWEIKGLDIALEALLKILPQYPDARLVVVGSGSTDASRKIRRSYAKLEEQGAVDYVGRKDQADIARYMWHADIALLPSREEALGVSVLEAMAAGLPVIGSSAGGIGEILANGEFGPQFDVGDVEQLASCIATLLGSADLRSDYAARSLRRVEDFSKEKMLAGLRAVYAELHAARRGQGAYANQ